MTNVTISRYENGEREPGWWDFLKICDVLAINPMDFMKGEKMTNADKIRSMTDEELANILVNIDEDYVCNTFCKYICKLRDKDCPVIFKNEGCPISTEGCILGWLQSDVEE